LISIPFTVPAQLTPAKQHYWWARLGNKPGVRCLDCFQAFNKAHQCSVCKGDSANRLFGVSLFWQEFRHEYQNAPLEPVAYDMDPACQPDRLTQQQVNQALFEQLTTPGLSSTAQDAINDYTRFRMRMRQPGLFG
jgi:hypothetical protein